MTSIHCRPFPGSWQTQFILLVVNENPDTVQVRNRVCEASPGQVLTPEAAFGTGHLVTRNISLTHQKPHAQVCHLRPLRPSQQAEEQPHDLHALCSHPEKETGLVGQGWAFSMSLAAALHGETPVDRCGEQKAGSTSFLLRETALPCAAYRNLGHKLQRALPPWKSFVQTNRKCGVKRVHG
jgi:hypothetical protein